MKNTKEAISSVEKILSELPEKYKNILIKRYGLKSKIQRHTLEAISSDYNVTRERIRQIENAAKKLILETDNLVSHTKIAVKDLKKAIDDLGGVAPERNLLSKFTDNLDEQDYLHFLLNLSKPFHQEKSREFSDTIWYTKKENFEAFKKSLNDVYKNLKTDEVLTEKDIIEKFIEKMCNYTDDKRLLKLNTVKKLINISKKIDSNPFGYWGKAESRQINLKGAKDYAYLILKEKKKPMHFREISNFIHNTFKKKINTATVHNELIKDKRFVLIGRGKYGLTEWKNYSGGTVVDVIKETLKKSGPMLKEEIIKKVLARKDVKEQTISINLSKKKFFEKNKKKEYYLVSNF